MYFPKIYLKKKRHQTTNGKGNDVYRSVAKHRSVLWISNGLTHFSIFSVFFVNFYLDVDILLVVVII